jgi:hypothetical protein
MRAQTMSVYALTPLAKADIFDIWSYIADDFQKGSSFGTSVAGSPTETSMRIRCSGSQNDP